MYKKSYFEVYLALLQYAACRSRPLPRSSGFLTYRFSVRLSSLPLLLFFTVPPSAALRPVSRVPSSVSRVPCSRVPCPRFRVPYYMSHVYIPYSVVRGPRSIPLLYTRLFVFPSFLICGCCCWSPRTQRADVVGMFAQPVTTAIAANYFSVSPSVLLRLVSCCV